LKLITIYLSSISNKTYTYVCT